MSNERPSLAIVDENTLEDGRLPSVESLGTRVNRLGRERPPVFSSRWSELGSDFSIVMSQILTEYFVAGFITLLPKISEELDIPAASAVWPTTAFSLVVASTLMVFGRIADQHGGYIVYLAGLAWLAVWSLIAGFSVNAIMLDICRAMQGLGAAAFLPTSVMLIGSMYRPGPRKNKVFSVYGGFSVGGFFIGIFFAGIIREYAYWGWYFWIGAILSAITFTTTIIFVKNDRLERKEQHIESDWRGSFTIVAALVLLVFAITESAHVSWTVAYVPATFALSIVLIAITIYIEGWIAIRPIIPADLFTTKGMAPLLLVIFLLYGTWGMFLLYGTQYWRSYMGASALQVVAWCVPIALGGFTLSLVEGFILHLIPGHYPLFLSGIAAIGAHLLMALIPLGANYWAWLFPAMILGTVSIDLSFILVMVFVTTKLPMERQGMGGGLVNSVLQLGVAICIGLSDILREKTKEHQGDRQSLKNVFWFGVGLSSLALIIMLIWSRLPKQKGDLTADEKIELQNEALEEGDVLATTEKTQLQKVAMEQRSDSTIAEKDDMPKVSSMQDSDLTLHEAVAMQKDEIPAK